MTARRAESKWGVRAASEQITTLTRSVRWTTLRLTRSHHFPTRSPVSSTTQRMSRRAGVSQAKASRPLPFRFDLAVTRDSCRYRPYRNFYDEGGYFLIRQSLDAARLPCSNHSRCGRSGGSYRIAISRFLAGRHRPPLKWMLGIMGAVPPPPPPKKKKM